MISGKFKIYCASKEESLSFYASVTAQSKKLKTIKLGAKPPAPEGKYGFTQSALFSFGVSFSCANLKQLSEFEKSDFFTNLIEKSSGLVCELFCNANELESFNDANPNYTQIKHPFAPDLLQRVDRTYKKRAEPTTPQSTSPADTSSSSTSSDNTLSGNTLNQALTAAQNYLATNNADFRDTFLTLSFNSYISGLMPYQIALQKFNDLISTSSNDFKNYMNTALNNFSGKKDANAINICEKISQQFDFFDSLLNELLEFDALLSGKFHKLTKLVGDKIVLHPAILNNFTNKDIKELLFKDAISRLYTAPKVSDDFKKLIARDADYAYNLAKSITYSDENNSYYADYNSFNPSIIMVSDILLQQNITITEEKINLDILPLFRFPKTRTGKKLKLVENFIKNWSEKTGIKVNIPSQKNMVLSDSSPYRDIKVSDIKPENYYNIARFITNDDDSVLEQLSALKKPLSKTAFVELLSDYIVSVIYKAYPDNLAKKLIEKRTALFKNYPLTELKNVSFNNLSKFEQNFDTFTIVANAITDSSFSLVSLSTSYDNEIFDLFLIESEKLDILEKLFSKEKFVYIIY